MPHTPALSRVLRTLLLATAAWAVSAPPVQAADTTPAEAPAADKVSSRAWSVPARLTR